MAAKIILTVKPSHQNNDTRQVLFPELFHFTATFKMNFVLQCNENRIFYYKIEFYSHTFLDWEGWVLIWLSPVLIKPIFDHQPFWRCFVKIYTSTKTPPLIVCFHKKSKGFLKNTPDQHYLWTCFSPLALTTHKPFASHAAHLTTACSLLGWKQSLP